MKSNKLIILFFCLFSLARAQDSTKVINQEVGFNTVSLIKQVISNNPGSTLSQLPYDIFYNIYYKDKIGVRLGLGIFGLNTKSSVYGSFNAESTESSSLNFRAGLTYNFVQSKRLTLNVFGDFTGGGSNAHTVSTTTISGFGSPVQLVSNITDNKARAMGVQAGVGVKFNIYRHLSLYAEVPVGYVVEKTSQENTKITNGLNKKTTSSDGQNTSLRIILPATVYLVLRF